MGSRVTWSPGRSRDASPKRGLARVPLPCPPCQHDAFRMRLKGRPGPACMPHVLYSSTSAPDCSVPGALHNPSGPANHVPEPFTLACRRSYRVSNLIRLRAPGALSEGQRADGALREAIGGDSTSMHRHSTTLHCTYQGTVWRRCLQEFLFLPVKPQDGRLRISDINRLPSTPPLRHHLAFHVTQRIHRLSRPRLTALDVAAQRSEPLD